MPQQFYVHAKGRMGICHGIAQDCGISSAPAMGIL